MTTTLGPDVVEHVIGQTGEFSLRLPAGHVGLRGVDGDAVRVRDIAGRPLSDRFEIDRELNRLGVRVRDGIHLGGLLRGGPHGSARLSVEVPRGASVTVDAASAEIIGSGLQGEQHYRSASGSIRLTGIAGTVAIESVSGDVTIEPDGQIRLTARSVSGEIAVRGGRLPSMALSSTSGDVEVDAVFDGQGPYGIQTVSGDAIVHAHGGIRVEAKTLTGQVASSVPHRSDSRRGQHDLVVGDGRVLLTFKSISGDLRIADSSPASGAAVSHAAPEPPAPPAPPEAPFAPSTPDVHEADRLAILRDLETGAIDVAEAGRRLAALEGESND